MHIKIMVEMLFIIVTLLGTIYQQAEYGYILWNGIQLIWLIPFLMYGMGKLYKDFKEGLKEILHER